MKERPEPETDPEKLKQFAREAVSFFALEEKLLSLGEDEKSSLEILDNLYWQELDKLSKLDPMHSLSKNLIIMSHKRTLDLDPRRLIEESEQEEEFVADERVAKLREKLISLQATLSGKSTDVLRKRKLITWHLQLLKIRTQAHIENYSQIINQFLSSLS